MFVGGSAQAARDQRGPAGLVAGTQPFAAVAVEILVEERQVAPVRVMS